MSGLTIAVLAYGFVMTIVGVISMASDKNKAKKHAWRTPEATLFLIALIGGGIGSTLGMYTFHHKTKHWYFVIGMPALAIVNVVMYYFLIKLTWGM